MFCFGQQHICFLYHHSMVIYYYPIYNYYIFYLCGLCFYILQITISEIGTAEDLERFLCGLRDEYLDENTSIESIFKINYNFNEINTSKKLGVAAKFGFDISIQSVHRIKSQFLNAISSINRALTLYIWKYYRNIWKIIIESAIIERNKEFINIVDCVNSFHKLGLAIETGFQLDESSKGRFTVQYICCIR